MLTSRIGYQTIPEIEEYRKRLVELFAAAVGQLLTKEQFLLETFPPKRPLNELDDDSNLTI